MGRNSKYWEKRLQKIADNTFERAAETAQERYRRVFDIAAEQINNNVTELYSRVLADGEVTPLSLYKKKRYANLKKNIKQMAQDMGMELNKETEKILTVAIEDTYTATNDALDVAYDRVPKGMVDQIVNSRWSGDNYSKRIWDNVETLATQVEKNVVQAVLTGKNKDDCVGEVMKRFGTSFSNADRLIRTEVMHSINDAQGETYKKAGYTKYRILIEHDERLCEVCEALANQEFDFDDKQEGVNCPPLHPNCRCTIVPVLDLQKGEKSDIIKEKGQGDNLGVDIKIDDFTPCLVEVKSGKVLDTVYSGATQGELKQLSKEGWLFDWTDKNLAGSEIIKLQLGGKDDIEGLIAIEDMKGSYAYHVSLAESAPHNRGKEKVYNGVGGHLFAIAAQKSMEAGYGGFLCFEAKNEDLVKYYSEMLGAQLIGGVHEYRMIVDESKAQELLDKYTLREK